MVCWCILCSASRLQKSYRCSNDTWKRFCYCNVKKQKLNTRSSTEAELVGADDAATMILWTGLFMEQQGYPLSKNILFQDNKSAILLETNGKRSAGKRSRAFNVRYLFLTDQVKKGNLTIEYCPTDVMWTDFMTKPLQGKKFRKFSDNILGIS